MCGSGVTCGRCCFHVSVYKAFLSYPNTENMFSPMFSPMLHVLHTGENCARGNSLMHGRCCFKISVHMEVLSHSDTENLLHVGEDCVCVCGSGVTWQMLL